MIENHAIADKMKMFKTRYIKSVFVFFLVGILPLFALSGPKMLSDTNEIGILNVDENLIGEPWGESKVKTFLTSNHPWLDHIYVDGYYGVHSFHGDITQTDKIPKFDKNLRQVLGRTSGISINRAYFFKVFTLSLKYNEGELRGIKEVEHNNNFYTFYLNYNNVLLEASYPVKLFLYDFKSMHPRYQLNPHLGLGIMTYRSKSLFTHEDNGGKVFQYYGYERPVNALASETGSLEKARRKVAFVVPVGVQSKFYLNSRFDLNIDYTYVYSFSDKIDGWERQGTAKDRYSAFTMGISYNFNRSRTDVNLSEVRTSKKESTGGNTFDPSTDEYGEIDPSILSSKDRMMYLLLKLYKTQLRLFQMQHLEE